MLLSMNQTRILKVNDAAVNKVKQTKANDNFVITIDIQKPVKIISAIFCCFEAGLINGKKYDGI